MICCTRLLDVGADMALILDDERLVGVCTRTDILKPHRAQLDHEQRAAGWAQRTLPGGRRGRRGRRVGGWACGKRRGRRQRLVGRGRRRGQGLGVRHPSISSSGSA